MSLFKSGKGQSFLNVDFLKYSRRIYKLLRWSFKFFYVKQRRRTSGGTIGTTTTRNRPGGSVATATSPWWGGASPRLTMATSRAAGIPSHPIGRLLTTTTPRTREFSMTEFSSLLVVLEKILQSYNIFFNFFF